MKKFFLNRNKYYLINRPILWITAMPWVLILFALIGGLQIIIGLIFPLSGNFSLFSYFVILILSAVCFLIGLFQFRNFEGEFSFRQTYLIYVLNIATYLLFGLCILILSLAVHLRFNPAADRIKFGKELLAVRIGSLTNDEILFIKRHPQLYTSKGPVNAVDTSSLFDSTGSLNLSVEYESRGKLDTIPFSKADLVPEYSIVNTLRYEKGFEAVDSLLKLNAEIEEKNAKTGLYSDYNAMQELDPDPIFYKFLSGLSPEQIDSIRMVKAQALARYGIEENKLKSIGNYYELKHQFDNVISNSNLPGKSEVAAFILVVSILSSIVFILVINKTIAPLIAIVVSMVVAVTSVMILPGYSYKLERYQYIQGSAATLTLFLITYFLIRKKGKKVEFFLFHCINVATVGLILSLIGFLSSEIVAPYLMVIAILVTEYFFIRKMYHKMSFS